MTAPQTDSALFDMVAHSLKASDAPRFLISIFTLPSGEHRLDIDLDHSDADRADAWLLVGSDNDRPRIRLSYCSDFPETDTPGVTMPSVWTHILVDGETLKETKSFEETLPASFEYEVDLRTLASGTAAIEDLCDACGLPRDSSLVGSIPAEPLESTSLTSTR
jgi:hypothetical protein